MCPGLEKDDELLAGSGIVGQNAAFESNLYGLRLRGIGLYPGGGSSGSDSAGAD